uniref:single-strand DNA endonuclease ASTE1 n=1 Tax=Semicossyphus pulcher TaxID=241346 RepID=UPI0037E70BE6
MGVQGMFKLLSTQGQVFRDIKFMKRRLVIDGCNLIYLLYFDSGLDLLHGGEYAGYEDLVERFIKALRDCGVSPYVVLDGGSGLTDKKTETVALRTVDRIQRAHQAAEESRQEKILPVMAKMVFIQTLARLKVPLAQCYGEADREIAALAREWECPVLSFDSDFLVFDLPGGLLPLTHFQWKAVKQSGSQSYIPCKFYKSSTFCIFFEIQPELLPAFAALAGNDYVKLERMDTPIRWAQFSPAGNWTPSNHLVGLLHWLKDFRQPKDAFEAALGLMGEVSKEKKAKVMKGLFLGMDEYQLPTSSLKKFFIHGVAPPYPEEEDDVADCVPDWTLLLLMQARLSADILDVLLLEGMSLSFPVESADMPTAHLTSRPIRQVMYRLLLGKGKDLRVSELDRDRHQLKSIRVQPACSGLAQQLELETLDQVEHSLRLQVLLEALGVTEASLSGLQPHLRLLVAVTCYWLQKAEPSPDDTLLKALLLGVSHRDALRQRADLESQNQPIKKKLEPDVSQAFNQWQSCLKYSIQLNQLLGFPLPEPQIARCYEGTVVHRLVHMMRTDQKLKKFLRSDRSSVREYNSMLAIVQRFNSSEVSALTGSPQRQRRPLEDLTATLKQLFLLYDEDEVSSAVKAHVDLNLDDLLSVRTRHRSKERSSRCDILVMARKQDCRGGDIL